MSFYTCFYNPALYLKCGLWRHMNKNINIRRLLLYISFILYSTTIIGEFVFHSFNEDKRYKFNITDQYIYDKQAGNKISFSNYIELCYSVNYFKTVLDCSEEWLNLSIDDLYYRNKLYENIYYDDERSFDSSPLLEYSFDMQDVKSNYAYTTAKYKVREEGTSSYIWGDDYIELCLLSASKTSEECIDEWNTGSDSEVKEHYRSYLSLQN